MTRQPQGNILGIDLLRFSSALMVLLYHLSYRIGIPESTPWRITVSHHIFFPWAEGVASAGWVGVEIFFAISGFVIAYSATHATAASFLRGRALRLVPAAWICASLTLPVAVVFHNAAIGELLAEWLRSVAFDPFGGYIDSVYWTLGIECSFYAVVLLLLFCNALRYVEWLFLLLAAISAVFCWEIFVAQPELRDLANSRPLQLALVVHGGEFAAGVFLFGLLYRGFTWLRAIGMFVSLLGGSIETTQGRPFGADALLPLLLWWVAIAVIAASVVFNDRLTGLFGERVRALARHAGLATYPLYLIHQILGAALMLLLVSLGVPPLASLICAILAMITLAHLVAAHLEPRVRDALKRLIAKGSRAVHHESRVQR